MRNHWLWIVFLPLALSACKPTAAPSAATPTAKPVALEPGTFKYTADDPAESHYIQLRQTPEGYAGDYIGTGVADSTFYFKTPLLDLTVGNGTLSFRLGEMDLYGDPITPATDVAKLESLGFSRSDMKYAGTTDAAAITLTCAPAIDCWEEKMTFRRQK